MNRADGITTEFFLSHYFLVVLCGAVAPILFQWLVSTDVSTSAHSSNGTIIPISTSLLLVLVLIHSTGFMRLLDKAKRIVWIRARPLLLLPNIIERSSPEKIQYSFFDALSILSFFHPLFPPLIVIQSPAALVGQYFGFVVSTQRRCNLQYTIYNTQFCQRKGDTIYRENTFGFQTTYRKGL